MYLEYMLLLTDRLLCVHNNFCGKPVPQEMLEHLNEVKCFPSRLELELYLTLNLTCDDLYALHLENGVRRDLVEEHIYYRR